MAYFKRKGVVVQADLPPEEVLEGHYVLHVADTEEEVSEEKVDALVEAGADVIFVPTKTRKWAKASVGEFKKYLASL